MTVPPRLVVDAWFAAFQVCTTRVNEHGELARVGNVDAARAATRIVFGVDPSKEEPATGSRP